VTSPVHFGTTYVHFVHLKWGQILSEIGVCEAPHFSSIFQKIPKKSIFPKIYIPAHNSLFRALSVVVSTFHVTSHPSTLTIPGDLKLPQKPILFIITGESLPKLSTILRYKQ